MVNYNPVVQSIAGMGKVEQPEYVDTRITMDLSSLGKLAEQTTGGLMEGARFEREMLSAMDRANRNRKADQYAALKEQRAAEKHQWAAEKHQFAINAEERAQTKFDQEQAQKGLLLNFSKDATDLLRSQEYNDAGLIERNTQLTKLMDRYTVAGIDPNQMVKFSNNLFGNISADLNQILVEKEKSYAKADQTTMDNYVKDIYKDNPDGYRTLTMQEKENIFKRDRTISENIEIGKRAYDWAIQNNIDPTLAKDTLIKAGTNGVQMAAYMAIGGAISQNNRPMTEAEKELVRSEYTNNLVSLFNGDLSEEEARSIINRSTRILDLPLELQKRLVKANGKEVTNKIIMSSPAMEAVYYMGGEQAVLEQVAASQVGTLSVINSLGNTLSNVKEGIVTMPDGNAVKVNGAVMGYYNSLSDEQKKQVAPMIYNMGLNQSNPPEARVGITDFVLEKVGDVVDVFSRNMEDVNKAIKEDDVSNLQGNLDVALGYIDRNEEAWKNSDIETKRDMSEQVNSLTYKTLAMVTQSLKEYGFGTFVVYDPSTNQVLPTRELAGDNLNVLERVAQTTNQAWRMGLISDVNELLKRVNRYSIDEKETKAFISNTMKDMGIETYDEKKHTVESPNEITRIWNSWGKTGKDIISLQRSLLTAAKEKIENGKVSEGTMLQLYADLRKQGKNIKDLGDELWTQSVELGEGLTELGITLKEVMESIAETDTFKRSAAYAKEKYTSYKESFLNLFNDSTEEGVENVEAAKDSFVEPTPEQTEQRVEQLEEIDEQSDLMFDENGKFKQNPEEVNQQLRSIHEAQQRAIEEAEMADKELMQNLESADTTENNVSSVNNKKDSGTESFKDPELQTLENIKTAGEVAGGGVAAAGAGYGAYKGGKSLYNRFADSVRTFYYTKINPKPAKIAERPGYSVETFTEAYRKQQRRKALARGVKKVAKGGLKGAVGAIATDFALTAESNLDSLVRGASQERTKEFAAASLKDQQETVKLYNQFKKAARTKEEKEALAFYGYPDIYRIFIKKLDKDTIKTMKKLGLDTSPTPRTLEVLVENYNKDKGKISNWANNTSLSIERPWW